MIDMAPLLYVQALKCWGTDAQIDMAIEEMAEAILAIQHWRRGRAAPADVASEIADVTIMMEQMRLIVDPELVDQARKTKLDRLETRLNMKPESGQ